MCSKKIIITGDRSHSVLNQELNEYYHSDKGAISESKHVYIENGLSQIKKNLINILEIGFGTGLNALLSYQYAKNNELNVNYITIEKYPLPAELIQQLNYADLLSLDNNLLNKMHECIWNQKVKIAKRFQLFKLQMDVLEFDFSMLPEIDLVYYDAFSPSKQPEIWDKDIFVKIYQKMAANSLLTSYSSAGIVKRGLRAAGFNVRRKPGADGKFHMLNAFKN